MNGLMRLLFSPDEPAGGEPGPGDGPDVELPTDKLAADLEKIQPDSTTDEEPTPEPEPAPAAPAPDTTAEDKTDYKAELEKAKAERDEYVQRAAQEAFQQEMARVASESPEMYERVYKVKPPPGMFKEHPPTPAATPQDALLQRLAATEAWQKRQDEAIAEAKRQAQVNQERQVQSERIYGALAKHKDVFNDKEFGDELSELAVAKFVTALNQNPKTANPDIIAEQIAKKFKARDEATKAKYVQGKKEIAAKVPVGAGAGGRQAGSPAAKKTWADLEKALGDGLKAADRGADD